MQRVNSSIQSIERIRAQPYDSKNKNHESMLERLWNALFPDIRRKGRITDEWEEIGFQGKDPATDFRGMGNIKIYN